MSVTRQVHAVYEKLHGEHVSQGKVFMEFLWNDPKSLFEPPPTDSASAKLVGHFIIFISFVSFNGKGNRPLCYMYIFIIIPNQKFRPFNPDRVTQIRTYKSSGKKSQA